MRLLMNIPCMAVETLFDSAAPNLFASMSWLEIGAMRLNGDVSQVDLTI
jgi:hypothetical protein